MLDAALPTQSITPSLTARIVLDGHPAPSPAVRVSGRRVSQFLLNFADGTVAYLSGSKLDV
jgi:hypothetical protein